MSDTHSIDARDLVGNRYRLTVYREMIGTAPRACASPSAVSPTDHPPLPVDIIGPRGEWVSVLRPGRYLLQPLEKDRTAIELFSDEPISP